MAGVYISDDFFKVETDTLRVCVKAKKIQIEICSYCGLLSSNELKLKRCGNCSSVFYCGFACQRAHYFQDEFYGRKWEKGKGHKEVCKSAKIALLEGWVFI